MGKRMEGSRRDRPLFHVILRLYPPGSIHLVQTSRRECAPVIARVSSHIYGGVANDGHGTTTVTNHQCQGLDRLAMVGCDHDWVVRWCGWPSTCGGAEFNSQTITYRRTLQRRRCRLCLVMEIRVLDFCGLFFAEGRGLAQSRQPVAASRLSMIRFQRLGPLLLSDK